MTVAWLAGLALVAWLLWPFVSFVWWWLRQSQGRHRR